MQSGEQVTLALDTSASPLLLSLEKDGKIYSVRRKGIKQEKLLFPALHALLNKAEVSLNNIGRIFLIRGPGRFTGIRISLTFASMMKYLNQAEIRGTTMFEALRFQTVASRQFQMWKKQNPQGVLGVVLHAFREEYFLQIFDAQNAGPAWLSREELLSRLAAYKQPLFITGNDKEGNSLSDWLGADYPVANGKTCKLQAASLLKMAKDEQWNKDALEPLYLKPARFELVKPI